MRTVATWIIATIRPITMALLWLGLVGVAIIVSAPPVNELVGDEPSEWAQALGSEYQGVREEAIKRFLEAGPEMCPLLVETALHGSSLQAESVLLVLHEFYRSSRPEYYTVAEQALDQLQNSPDADVTALTLASWSQSRKLRLDRCAARFEELGGSVRIDPSQWGGSLESDFRRATTAVLDANWRGGEDGLEHVLDIPGLQVIEVTPDTSVSPDAIAKLQEERPDVAVVRRGNATMGVEGVEQSNGFLVVAVVPGGGAEKAGLEPRDYILNVGGVSASSFRDVANLVAEHSPGDVLSMVVQREEDVLELSVTLGSRD
ncbi:PDZ domain-containing protein [Thalassoroseus pseudoceratinae]|uniref:PDZ domain-containing protein n=1 Tax=Thalassoroseus pseudoceratinae TaxID=2713176 RepID=UPI00141F502C|nr:PDZ domain-containing protein [Thalassoroseus pseudoceratinae]